MSELKHVEVGLVELNSGWYCLRARARVCVCVCVRVCTCACMSVLCYMYGHGVKPTLSYAKMLYSGHE